MKTKYSLILICGLIALLVSGYFIFLNEDRIKPINCNQMGAIYLKPLERVQAQDIANHINGVVVIPEDNEIIGRSDILLCPNFEPSNYINTGGLI